MIWPCVIGSGFTIISCTLLRLEHDVFDFHKACPDLMELIGVAKKRHPIFAALIGRRPLFRGTLFDGG
jgi:hypothetical protein